MRPATHAVYTDRESKAGFGELLYFTVFGAAVTGFSTTDSYSASEPVLTAPEVVMQLLTIIWWSRTCDVHLVCRLPCFRPPVTNRTCWESTYMRLQSRTNIRAILSNYNLGKQKRIDSMLCMPLVFVIRITYYGEYERFLKNLVITGKTGLNIMLRIGGETYFVSFFMLNYKEFQHFLSH